MKKGTKDDKLEANNGLMSWYKKYDDSKGTCKKCTRRSKKRCTDKASCSKNDKNDDETVACTEKNMKECKKSDECKKQCNTGD